MKTIVADLSLLVGLTILSGCIGIAVGALGEPPLSLSYRPPAQRLLASNPPSSAEVPVPPSKPERPPVVRQIEVITLAQFLKLKGEDQLLILDVRPDLFYKIGHIPGALSLQAREFDADHAMRKEQLQTALKEGKKIAIYCGGGTCPDASKVASSLSGLGYGNLMVFEAGWEGWQQSGLEEAKEGI